MDSGTMTLYCGYQTHPRRIHSGCPQAWATAVIINVALGQLYTVSQKTVKIVFVRTSSNFH